MNLKTSLESQVLKTLKKIKISKTSRIIVALSGGKDSTVVAYLLKKFGYSIEGIHIDLKIGKYSDGCLKKVVELCEMLSIPLHIYDMKKEMGSGMCYLRTAIQEEHLKQKKSSIKNCAVCGVIKKWILNKVVRNLKADYIATGHNLDDEVQTFLMNVFKGSLKLSSNVGAISRNISYKKLIPRIKPLFYVLEEDIKKYSKRKNLPVIYEKCPCALDSYRIQIRNFLEKISGKEKRKIIQNFELLLPKIEKLRKNSGIIECKKCREPSRSGICKKCQLMEMK